MINKFILFSWSILCVSTNLFALDDVVVFKDSVFLNNLIAPCNGIGCPNVDKNKDGKIQISEAEQVTTMSTGGRVTSVKGIEAFKNLIKLSINYCDNLDSVDLSLNKKLYEISAYESPNIKYVNINGLTMLRSIVLQQTKVETIDVSTNTNMDFIYISGVLKTIDISKNLKLISLWLYSYNLSCLDVSKNEKLKHLFVKGSGITSLNLNNNKNLTWLNTTDTKLRHLDLTYNTELDTLEIGNDRLTELNLQNNTKLLYFIVRYEQLNNPNFKILDLSKQAQLKILALIGYLGPFPIKKVCLPSLDSTFLKGLFIQNSQTGDSVQFVTGCQQQNILSFSIATDTNKICLGLPINFKIYQPDSVLGYQLNYGDGSNSLIPNLIYTYPKAGNFTSQLIADYGCYKDTANTNVMVYAQPPQSIFDNYTCTKNAMVLDAGLGYQHYQWQNGDTTQTVQVNQAGKYKVTASNICGSITDSTEVQFIKKQLAISTPRLCVIDEAEFDVQNIQYPVLNYHWAYGNNATATTNQTKYKYPKSGTYNANLVVDYYCFKDTATTQVIVDDTPILNIGDSIITCSNDAIELNAGAGFVSYLWQDGSKNQIYTSTQTGIYSVAVTNTCGTQTDSVSIKKVQLDVPNIITPNNDGLNEALQIKSQLPNPIYLNIVNRWGGEVFNSSNYQNNWDANGLSDGIYYYTSNYEGCEAVKGWVQVVR